MPRERGLLTSYFSHFGDNGDFWGAKLVSSVYDICEWIQRQES